jgi:hypothetical protein
MRVGIDSLNDPRALPARLHARVEQTSSGSHLARDLDTPPLLV